MKKLLKSLVSLTAILSILVTGAYAGTVFQYETPTTLADGITLTNINRFTTSGWLNINVARIDLNNPDVKLKVLTASDSDIAQLGTVKKMAEKENTDVAINTDFFQWSSTQSGHGSSLGPVIKDGEMQSSPSSDNSFAGMFLDQSDMVYMDYFNYAITITMPDGSSADVKGMNKLDALDSIMIYNKHWGTTSMGSYNNIVEVVVQNDTVTEIRREQPGIPFPENGYIITGLADHIPFLTENIHVGDKIKLDISCYPDLSWIKEACGGGTLLIKNGIRPTFTHNITGNQPRTAVGCDETRKIVYFVTVDGRLSTSRGVTQTELADIMAELGCYDAINMDGGGSTTMVAKDRDNNDTQTVVNTPSDGAQRAVSVGLGAVNTQPKSGILGKLELVPEDENVFVNTSRVIGINAYDTGHYSMDVPGPITWSVDGVEGTVDPEGNLFLPASTGTATITATIGDVSGSCTVNVWDDFNSLETDISELDMKSGETRYISLWGKNNNGYLTPMNVRDTTVTMTNQNVSFVGNNLIAQSSGGTTLNFQYNGKNVYIKVNVDGIRDENPLPGNTAFVDQKQSQEIADGYKVAVFGQTANNGKMIDLLFLNKLVNDANSLTDASIFAGQSAKNLTNLAKNPISSYGAYSYQVIGDATYFTIDNTANTINTKTTNGQWDWFTYDISQIATNNVFITLSKPPDTRGFSDTRELQVFKDLLKEKVAGNGRNVFVIYPEDNTDTYTLNFDSGIRYIGVRGLKDIQPGSILHETENLGYLIVSVNGNDISYTYKKIY